MSDDGGMQWWQTSGQQIEAAELTQADLHELINFDTETGVFTWKKSRRGVKTGKQLGTCNGNGYLRITVLGRSYYAHRLAWFYVYGEWPEHEIDHINAIKGDNRITNLRKATPKENNGYKFRPQSNSKSGFIGVSWHKKASKWQAFHKREYLGVFSNIDDAVAAYMTAKEQSWKA